MNDKKRPVNDESDRQYLERSGTSSHVKEALAKVIENRPEDPISFIADYFESFSDKANRIQRAHQQILLTHHSKPAFVTNVRTAYDLMSQQKVNKTAKGVNGNTYMELMRTLCRDIAPAITEKLFKKIRCRDHEVVNFDVYKSGVFTCLVLRDFIYQSEALYQSLDANRIGKINKNLAEIVLDQLENSIKLSQEDNDTGNLQAAVALSPANLHDAISDGMTSYREKTMSLDEFTQKAAESFIIKVPELE